jgi:hypothetical protein
VAVKCRSFALLVDGTFAVSFVDVQLNVCCVPRLRIDANSNPVVLCSISLTQYDFARGLRRIISLAFNEKRSTKTQCHRSCLLSGVSLSHDATRVLVACDSGDVTVHHLQVSCTLIGIRPFVVFNKIVRLFLFLCCNLPADAVPRVSVHDERRNSKKPLSARIVANRNLPSLNTRVVHRSQLHCDLVSTQCARPAVR